MKNSFYRKTLALMLGISLILNGLAGCRTPENTPGSGESFEASGKTETQQAFDNFTDEVFREEIVENTLNLHYILKEPENFGIDDYEISLGDATPDSMKESFELEQALLDELEGFSYEELTDQQKMTYDILHDNLTVSLESRDLLLYFEELSPLTGTPSQLPVLMAEYSFYDERDVQDYLALLEKIPTYYEQLIAFEQVKSENGLFMSDRAVDDIIETCNSFLADPETHYLIQTFDERIQALTDISDEKKEEYKAKNREVFASSLAPAYHTLIDGLTALKGTGQYEGGLCRYPEGKAYYEYLVRMGTGTGHTIEELKTLINERVEQQLTEFSILFMSSGLTEDDLTNFSFSLSDPAEILKDLKGKFSEDFPEIPDTNYTIKYVPEPLEDALSPAFYLTPPLDAPQDNVIYINNSQVDGSSLYSTLAHEGYPGHLYQSVYEASRDACPLLSLLSCSGYSEGWATYVEHYSYGLDDGIDPQLAQIMSLNSSATLGFYAAADIGINYDGWTLEDTASFIHQYFGIQDQETVEEFYYAMVEEPANYLNYYIGYLEILLLRERAEEALGEEFVLKDFHKFILDMGGCSFRVINKYFENWLAEQMPEETSSKAG
ncbi:MAG: DUF885 domain-containing protein [Lachnospiraceae bacterium]|nr:DUF885 domain-containing protein [Lachnospiraceae bacterium]